MVFKEKNIALTAFEMYGDTVLRVAYCYTGNMADAEDITQEVFLKLHALPQDFNDNEHMKAWLIRAAVNRSKNHCRSLRVRGRCRLEDSGIYEKTVGFGEGERELLDVVRSLPDKYRSVIHLYYYEGYSIKEIAQLLKKSGNTVSSLLRRARNKLKDILEEE